MEESPQSVAKVSCDESPVFLSSHIIVGCGGGAIVGCGGGAIMPASMGVVTMCAGSNDCACIGVMRGSGIGIISPCVIGTRFGMFGIFGILSGVCTGTIMASWSWTGAITLTPAWR